MNEAPIGVVYQHPLWFAPLFAELDRRDVRYARLHADELVFDPGEQELPYGLVLNRMSPSAWTRGHANAIFHTLHFLAYFDEIGHEVVNGQAAFQVEISKARLRSVRAPRPQLPERARAVDDVQQLEAAAEETAFPGAREAEHRRKRRRDPIFRNWSGAA